MRTFTFNAKIGALLLLVQLCQAADPLDNWSQQRFGTNIHLTRVAFGGGQFVITGYKYDTNFTRTGLIITSADGVNWTSGNSETTRSLSGVTYGKGQFVAVGDEGTIILSPDGTNWTKTISGTTSNLTSVAYGNDHYIAVGNRVPRSGVASIDGTNWANLNLDFLPRYVFQGNTVGYGAGQFILLRRNTIFTSSNGTDWTDRFSANGATGYSDVAFGNGRFVVIGDSADVGGGGNVATSPDGVTWSALDTGKDHVLYDIAFGSGRFVAVGGFDQMGGGLIFSSSDGTAWTPHPSGLDVWVEGIAYGNGRFVAVGDWNAILSTEAIIRLDPVPALAGGGSPQFNVIGPAGQSCRIQASTDLANWVTLTNMLCPDGVGQFVDLSATNFSHRFYQAVSP